MNINKDKLFKYGEYLKESIDPWKLKKTIKPFNRIPEDVFTIYGDLKSLSIELTDELENIKLPYTKVLVFGGIEIDLEIVQTGRYYSSVDWLKFLSGDSNLKIEVEKNYDLNYLVSTIIHEIRHMIDFTDENLNSGLSSFDIEKNLRKYNIDNFNAFFILVYISLEHELVARNNQIYPYIKFKNLTNEQSLEILKKSFIWKAILMLRDFDWKAFIDRFDEIELINITNNFIVDCLYDKESKVENLDDLILFYKTWDEYFREVSNKWEKILLTEVDRTYERKVNTQCNFHRWEDILSSIWISIKKN